MSKYASKNYIFQPGETRIRQQYPRPGFQPDYKFLLTDEDYDKVMSDLDRASMVSYDTETTSLHIDELIQVSFSFAYEDKVWVCLINHEDTAHCYTNYDNLRQLVLKLLTRPVCFLFNSRFDLRVSHKTFGINPYAMKTWDVQSLIFYADSNQKMPALKPSELFFLGIDAPEFDASWRGPALQHAPVDKLGLYSAYDAYATLRLGELFYPEIVPRYPLIAKLDRSFIPALMWFEDSIFDIDRESIIKTQADVQEEAARLKEKIFDAVGVFLLTSTKQLAEKLTSLGYDTGVRTKTGQMSTGTDALLNLENVEFVKWIIDYKKMVKLDTAYLQPMLKRIDLNLPFRFHYILNNAPTMRLAAGAYSKSKKKVEQQTHYFADINFQSIPKPKKLNRHVHWDPKTLEIDFRDDGEFYVETGDPKANLRRAFVPPDDDFIYFAIDYSGQELRLTANMSGETQWINAFNSGGDVHKSTAISIWGEDHYDGNKRKKAKIANFGCPTRDTYLNTQRGLVHPQDLKFEDRIFDRFGNLQTWKMKEIEDQDIITFEFSNGLKESYHCQHRFLCVTPEGKVDWVFAQDLTPEHEIISCGASRFYQGHPRSFEFHECTGRRVDKVFSVSTADPYFAYLTGLFLGDGSIGKSSNGVPNCVRLVSHEDDYDWHCENVARLGFTLKEERRGEGWVTARILNSSLAKFFAELFPSKTFSPAAWTMFDTQGLSYVFAGLMDADGKACHGSAAFTNSNRQLVSDVARIVSVLGGYSVVRESQAGITEPDGTRRYCDKTGASLPTAYELAVYLDFPYPVRREHKQVYGKTKLEAGFHNFSSSFLEKIYEAEKQKAGGYHGKAVQLADNLRTGRQKSFNRSAVRLFAEHLEREYQFSSEVMPVRVQSATWGKGSIFTLQTENHEYLSSFLVSHNTVYGGGVFFLMTKLKMTQQEAEDFQSRYKAALPRLFAWTDQVHDIARRQGYIISPYGLPRRLSYYYRQGGGVARFADRSAVNTLIQGSAGVIIRLALTRLFNRIGPKLNEVTKADFYGDVFFRGSIHDEIDGVCRKSRFREFIDVITPIMTDVLPAGWPVPMEVEVSVGNNWGEMFAVDYHDPNFAPIEVEEEHKAAVKEEEDLFDGTFEFDEDGNLVGVNIEDEEEVLA